MKIQDKDVTEKYKDIIETDIIEPIRPLIQKGNYRFNKAGRLEGNLVMPSESPWVHIRQDPQRNCGVWSGVWFQFYNIVPSYCQNCWKVVVRPRTLAELFKMHDLMCELDLNSKLGIERRYSVPALYGAYFYNNSREEGLECYENVRAAVSERISPDIKMLLKRGCTELEHKFGDSSKWEVTERQRRMESILEDLFEDQPKVFKQSNILKRHIMANWVRFAYAQGDPTAKDFMSKPLYPPYVTYHEEDTTDG